MGNIVQFDGFTSLDIDTAEMLRNIADEKPANAFVVVWPEDGSLPTYHSNTSDVPVILMRLNEFIHQYYNGDFNA